MKSPIRTSRNHAGLRSGTALKAFSPICALRPSFTSCLLARAERSTVPSTGGVKTPPPGLHQRPGGPYPCIASHRRGPSRAHIPALVVGSQAVAQGSCVVGRGRCLRDRTQPAELAVSLGRLSGRDRLLLHHLGLVEDQGSGRSSVRGRGSGAGVASGSRGAVGARSLRPVGVPVASGRVGEALKGWGWKPQACEADGASPPGGRTFPTWFAGSRQVSSPACQREAGFHPRTDSVRL